MTYLQTINVNLVSESEQENPGGEGHHHTISSQLVLHAQRQMRLAEGRQTLKGRDGELKTITVHAIPRSSFHTSM